MSFYAWLASVVFVGICLIKVSLGDSSTWKSGPPDGLPTLNKFNVECGKEEMTIHLAFTAPYDGSVYSKSNGQSQRCIYVHPHSHVTETTFSINYHTCGTRSDSHGKYYENTIIMQYDDVVIEAWDEAKKIRCEWHDGYEKSAFKMPITISDLDVVEMNFQGDDVDCWLEVQDGKGPWSAKVEGLVPLGSPLTLVVAIQDSEGQFDMRVKSCIAHEGHRHPIHLTDEDGCVLRPKMMSPFQKTSDTKGAASVIAYSHFYAFKFPETVEVTIQCTVEICRHGCPDTCYQGRDVQAGNFENMPGPGKDQEIPTYKDSHPFSTIVTSKPRNYSYTSVLNASSSSSSVSSQSTNSSEDEPLKASSNTHHDYYVNRFPYDLYDLLEAEERVDKDEDELFTNEDDYVEKNPIYFPPLINGNEKGKNFASHQDVKNISGEYESINTSSTIQPDIISKVEGTEDVIPKNENASTVLSVESKSIVDKKEDNPKTQSGVDYVNEPDNIIEITTSTEPVTMGSQDTFANTAQEQTLNELFSAELFKNDADDAASTKTQREPMAKEKFQHIQEPIDRFNAQALKDPNTLIETNSNVTGEALYEYNTSLTNIAPIKDPRDSREVGKQETLQNLDDQKRDFKNEDTAEKTPAEDYDYYEVNFRRPIDNNEMRHNIHNYNYHPFVPPAPLPPITLYNGLPLYYYNKPSTNLQFFDTPSYEYSGRYPYKRDYIKSKLRRPGTRRGRREIGEKEQLGLKHTLRVVATTDFDFLIKDNEKSAAPTTQDLNTENDVCIAPSSFAAGLGLLLLANVCVLCVVVFLGHHYCIYRNKKVKNTELLSTEMT